MTKKRFRLALWVLALFAYAGILVGLCVAEAKVTNTETATEVIDGRKFVSAGTDGNFMTAAILFGVIAGVFLIAWTGSIAHDYYKSLEA